ncbi:MAG: PAS domain S-box protein, partial [Aggregatilineales bacterium]
MDTYRLILLTAADADADLTEIRCLVQAAALPEPLIYPLNGVSPANLYALAPDLILAPYSSLARSCQDLLGCLARSPEVPIILLLRPEEWAAAHSLAELHHVLPFDYVQSNPYMLRQVVNFAVQQRRTQRLLEQNLQAFSDSSRLLYNLINHNADGMLVIDREGIIRFANQSAETLFGRSVEALIGLPFGFPLVLGRTTELDLRTADGHECVVEMQLVTTEWEGQMAYLAALRDITERSLAQRHLQQRLALESLLATISAQFVSLPIAEVDERIHDALEQLGQFIGADRALLADLAQPPSERAITHIWEAEHVRGRYPLTNPQLAYRLYIEVFQRQDILIVPDTEQLPPEHPNRPWLLDRGVRTLMAIAMRNNGVLRGCLVFSAISQTRPWQHEDAALLSIAADVFASALRRAEINRALRESEARLRFVMNNAPLILFTFNRKGVIDFLEGALVDQRYPQLRPKVGHSALEDRFIGDYLRKVLQGESHRLTFELSDSSAIELYLTPLRDDGGAIIGGIAVGVDVTERERAQQAERRYAASLKTLADASIALTRSLQVQSVLETILEYAERLVPCEGSWIVLLKGDAGEVRAARGRSAESIHRRWEVLASHWDARSRLERSQCADGIELIPDTAAYPDWLPIEGTEWIRSHLSLLIELEGRIIGAI